MSILPAGTPLARLNDISDGGALGITLSEEEWPLRGVLVRDRSYEIEGCVRITVGTREQMRKLLVELEDVWRTRK